MFRHCGGSQPGSIRKRRMCFPTKLQLLSLPAEVRLLGVTRSMRTLFIGCFLLALGSAQQPRSWDADTPSSWGAPTNGWQLALRARKQSFLTGETVAVSL